MSQNDSDKLFHQKQAAALGDEEAFRQIFEYYAQKLTQFSYSITRNKDAAREVLDEVFVKVWKNRTKLPEIENLTTYLYTAVKNSSLNYLSRKANEQKTEPFDFVSISLSTATTPEESMISAELFKKINDAVEFLPPKCKMIFKLVREDGLKYKEIGEILNISVNTVDAQMVIAIRKISEKVKMHFDTFPQRPMKKYRKN